MPWQPEGPQEFKNLCFIFNSLSLCCQKPFLSVKGSVDVSSGEGVPAVGVNVDSFTFSHGQRLGQCGQFCPLSRCSGCQWLCPDGLCFRGYGCPHVSDSFSATAAVHVPGGIRIRQWLVLEISSDSVHLCQNFFTVMQRGGSQSGLGSSVAGFRVVGGLNKILVRFSSRL